MAALNCVLYGKWEMFDKIMSGLLYLYQILQKGDVKMCEGNFDNSLVISPHFFYHMKNNNANKFTKIMMP
jgi:hypothetical protein